MTRSNESELRTEEPDSGGSVELVGDIATTFNHRAFTLIGTTFLIFECMFLSLYGSDSWFGMNISWLGIPAILLAAVISHCLLRWVESPAGCRFFAPIWIGKPPTVYWRLVSLTDSDLIFGDRHIRWDAIDELPLTFFGNLLVKSRSICGPAAPEADLVAKLPIGAVCPQIQKDFISAVRSRKPALITNKRLKKRLKATEIQGTALVQSFGVVFMTLILLDLGQSTFSFLQINREYYLAQVEARDGNMEAARKHFQSADELRDHPFPLSWVNTKLLGQGTVAAGVAQLRSEALWMLGRKNEAVAEARKAVECSPNSFRLNLRLARLLADNGDRVESRAQIRMAIKNHKDSLLPRLYMLAELAEEKNSVQLSKFYQLYLDDLTDMVYGDEPWWPPGGNRFLHEIFFSEDVTFVFDRLLSHPYTRGERSASEQKD